MTDDSSSMMSSDLPWVDWWHPEGHQWADTTPSSKVHRVRPDDPTRTVCGRLIPGRHVGYSSTANPAVVCRSCARFLSSERTA